MQKKKIKKNSVWIFCSVCKRIEKMPVGNLYHEYNIPPNHKHGFGTIHLTTFETRFDAIMAKKNYKPMKFGTAK